MTSSSLGELIVRHRKVGLEYPITPLGDAERERLSREVDVALEAASTLEPHDRLALGTALGRLGRWEEALSHLESGSAGLPEDPVGIRNRGIALLSLYRNAQAAQALAPLAGKRDAPIAVLAAYGDALLRFGDRSEAARIFSRALASRPGDSYLLARVWEASRSGDSDALAGLRREAARGHGGMMDRIRLGRALLDEGLTAEALGISEEAVRRMPDEPLCHQLRAQVLAGLGRSDDSAAEIARMLELAPANGTLHMSAALVLKELGRLDAALVEAERACQLLTGDLAVLAVRSGILARLGRVDDAVQDLDRALELDPTAIGMYADKAVILEGARRYEEALGAVATGLALRPQDQGLLERKARILLTMERAHDALQTCDAILAMDPDCAETRVTRAMALFALDRDDEALAEADRGVSLDPDDAYGWRSRGEIRHTLNQFEDALVDIERSLAIDARSPRGWFLKGEILSALERYGDAVAAYDRSLELYPHPFTEARRALAVSQAARPTSHQQPR